MRISTSQFYNTSSANYQRSYANTVKSQQDASDNLRIRSAADDPVGSARLLQLEQQQNMLKQYSTNVTSVRNALGTAETTLSSISTLLQRVNELAVSSGNGAFTDSDRKANADELSSLESQLYTLMNTKDETGSYLFSGSKGSTQPYVRNADGTYSYQGDEVSLTLQVGDMISLAANETGYSAFEQALNTSRSETKLLSPATDDGRVSLSNGQVSGNITYNDRFRSGEPYQIEFTSSTQLKITDAAGKDVTAEVGESGTFNPSADSNTLSFRGVDLRLQVKPDSADPDGSIAGHVFSLSSKADTLVGTRSAGNPSTAQVTGASISDQNAYQSTFPGESAVLRFTSDTDVELYAAPVNDNSRPVAKGTLADGVVTVAGVSFQVGGTPAAADQFMVKVDTHQTQNVLDTISQLRKALTTPMDKDPAARQTFLASLDAAVGNIANASNQVGASIASIGGRGQALDVQTETNEALSIENTKTQSSIRESDPAEVMLRLQMQSNMLSASLQAYAKIANLSLVNYI